MDFTYLANRADNRATDPGPLAGVGLAQTRGDRYLTSDWLHPATAAWKFDRAKGSLKVYRDDGQADWLRRTAAGNGDSLNDYRLSGVRGRETLRPWEGGEVLTGADYDVSRGASVSVPAGSGPAASFGPRTFRLFSAYTGLAQTWRTAGKIEITPSAGVRYYDHDPFGAAWAPQAGLVVRRGGTELHASFGRALNFPWIDVAAFSTLAIPALGQTWRTLRPERADQSEIGLRHEFTPELAAELTVFRNEGSGRYVFVAPPPPFRYANSETFRNEGAELTLTARTGTALSLFGGVAHLDVTPADLPYAPRWSLVGGATWRPWTPLTVNVDASYTAAQRAGSQVRAGGATNAGTLSAFAVCNARIGYAFPGQGGRGHREVFVAGENLLNREYRYQVGYPMSGASCSAGVTLAF